MRFLISVLLVVSMATMEASAEPEAIGFSDLADPAAMAFDDPYKDMGSEMLNELKLLVQLEEELADDTLSQEERVRLEARRLAVQDKFAANGQDSNSLPGFGKSSRGPD